MLRPALIVHGGAGRGDPEIAAAQRAGCAAAWTAGWRILAGGGAALDAVTAAVTALEDDPAFNAGVGSVLTADGRVEMDASIMHGAALAAGAVALVSTVVNPIRLARAVMEEGRHVLLAGAAAEALAREHGLAMAPPEHFITGRQRARLAPGSGTGTVGAVAVDVRGHVAAATSTGGVAGKRAGRIGDSALIAAGTYADDRAGAASATGHGESIIRVALAKTAVDRLRGGADPAVAARAAIRVLGERVRGEGGVIVVDRFGRGGWAHNTERMTVCAQTDTAA
jgi:beta-aspartyl-peptidase (threonine type)